MVAGPSPRPAPITPARRTCRPRSSRDRRPSSPTPNATVTEADRRAFRAANAYWLDDWLAYGGALDDQIRFEREWQALRAYAAARGVRIIGDIPIYAGHRRRRPAGPPGAVPPRCDRRRAAGRVRRDGTALAQPALRLARAPRRRLPLVGRAPAARVPARRSGEDRPLPRLRLVLGRSGREPERRGRPLAPRARRGRLPGRRGGARPARRDRGGSRRDHGARPPPAPRARLPRHGRPPVRRRRRREQPAPAAEPRRAVGRLHGDARQRHGARLVVEPLGRRARLDGAARRRSVVGAARDRLALRGRAGDRAAAGRARARLGGAHEHAGDGGGQLALAARARTRSPRPTPPGCAR